MKRWIEDVYRNRSYALAESGDAEESSTNVAARMFTVMIRERAAGASWAQVEQRLVDMKGVLGLVSDEWEDYS